MMHLTVSLPTHILIDTTVRKVVAEAPTGSFCLLPRHVDRVSALVPGLFAYTDAEGEDHYVGVADGLLVKQGREVRVATLNAVKGPALGELHETIRREFLTMDERERRARSALARLEADFARRFIELSRE